MHPNRVLFAVFLAAVMSGCADRSPKPQVVAGGVSITRAEASAHAGDFSGRVPRLSGEEQPRDTLALHRLFGDSLAFAAISGIQPVGGRLFITDRLMSKHLALIDVRTGSVQARAGNHGEGPNEFRDPGAFMVQSASPPRTWVYDFQNRRLSLLSAGAGGKLSIEESRPFNVGESIEQPLRSGAQFIANGLFTDYTLLVLDSAAKPVRRIDAGQPYPARTMPHTAGRRLLNRSYLAADPGRSRLALAYQWASRIDFFSADGSHSGSAEGPRSTTPKYRITDNRFFWDPQGEMAYTGVQATDSYVYAMFCGCREADDPDQRSQRVHVFRWDGDFVAELQLDRKVTAFAVSPDDAFLYAAVTEPHPAVAEWRLPPALRSGGAPE
jgi:hypothetical protein